MIFKLKHLVRNDHMSWQYKNDIEQIKFDCNFSETFSTLVTNYYAQNLFLKCFRNYAVSNCGNDNRTQKKK